MTTIVNFPKVMDTGGSLRSSTRGIVAHRCRVSEKTRGQIMMLFDQKPKVLQEKDSTRKVDLPLAADTPGRNPGLGGNGATGMQKEKVKLENEGAPDQVVVLPRITRPSLVFPKSTTTTYIAPKIFGKISEWLSHTMGGKRRSASASLQSVS